MNFFEKQAHARRSTTWLVALFVLVLIAIVAAVDLVVVALYYLHAHEAVRRQLLPPEALANIIAVASVATLALIGLCALYKTLRLRGGGHVVAEAMGATRAPPNPTDPDIRRLQNIVEEMSIASGVPVPTLYVMERETGINAFAAGYSPDDAVIAVTRGAIDQLDRDELQGVIAHEYSHVLNGDMRLNIRLMGLLFGILALTVIGRILVRMRGGNQRGNQLALLGFGLLVVGSIGVFFARWIKAGVSRQREYLADASAVQFTRQTRGLAGALKKIARYGQGSRLQAPDTEEVSHMLFASGIASRLFATHPPIEARIRRLDPAFNPQIARSMQPPAATTATSVTGANAFAGPVAAADPSASSSAPAAAAVSAVTPEAVVTRIGELTAEHVQRAGALRDALPESLRDAAHDAVGAPVLVLALLLAPDEAARGAQLQRIEAGHGADLRARAFALLPQVQALERLQRLPLAALCLPALRTLDKADLRRLKGTVHALIHADGRVDVAEYALGAMLDTQLGDTLRPSAAGRPGGAKLRQHTDDVVNVLTVFANVGHGGAHTGSRAFGAGLRHALPNIQAPYAPRAQWHENFDAALHRLDRVRMGDKARLLEAIVVTLRHDGVITIDEYELLRSVCALLHCPLPLPSGA